MEKSDTPFGPSPIMTFSDIQLISPKKKELWRGLEQAKEGGVFFDIGANVGLYSLYAANAARGLRVYSFEPHKFNFATLLENIFLNQLEKSVHPVSLPLGDGSGLIDLNYNSMDSGTSMTQLGHRQLPGDREFQPKLSELVYSVTVDELVASGGVPGRTW